MRKTILSVYVILCDTQLHINSLVIYIPEILVVTLMAVAGPKPLTVLAFMKNWYVVPGWRCIKTWCVLFHKFDTVCGGPATGTAGSKDLMLL